MNSGPFVTVRSLRLDVANLESTVWSPLPTHTHIRTAHTHVYTHVHFYVCTHMCPCMYAHTYTHMCVHTQIFREQRM